MYNTTLALHNIARWIVLAAGVMALLRAYRGWFGGRAWSSTERRANTFFSVAIDVQFLLGLILTVTSPIVKGALLNFGRAIRAGVPRFFLLKHVPLMIAVVAIVHITSEAAKKAPDDVAKHRRAAIGYSLAFLLILIAIPWWRRLFPGLG